MRLLQKQALVALPARRRAASCSGDATWRRRTDQDDVFTSQRGTQCAQRQHDAAGHKLSRRLECYGADYAVAISEAVGQPLLALQIAREGRAASNL